MSTTREFTARHRFARITARKAGLIANMIRGRSVNEALELLQFTPNRGSAFYSKVLRSAVANASHDESVNMNRLFVSECRADDGPLLQGRLRYRPGPQGRAMPFAKRLSHLVVKVRELDGEAGPRRSIEEPSAAETTEAKPKAKKASAPKAKAAKEPKAEEPAKGGEKKKGKKA